jgi:hypothetical protein
MSASSMATDLATLFTAGLFIGDLQRSDTVHDNHKLDVIAS